MTYRTYRHYTVAIAIIANQAAKSSVIFVLIYFLGLVLVLVFHLFFRFSFVLVLQYFFVLFLVLPTTK